MKELEKLTPDKEDSIVNQAQHKTHKLVGNMRPVPGLTLYEFNPNTNVVDEAEFKEEIIIEQGHPVIHKKVLLKKDHIYFQALNKKNAAKKIIKLGL